MNVEDVRNYCLSKQDVTEGFPFDDTTLVFKVKGKMFALLSLNQNRLNVKCNPEKAVELREHYQSVVPAFHMNKKHWNTVMLNGDAGSGTIKKWIDDSYVLVVKKLDKKNRERLLKNIVSS